MGVAVGEGTGVSVGITIGVGVGQAGRVGVGSGGGALHAVSATSATHPATAITRSEYSPIVFAGMVTIALEFGELLTSTACHPAQEAIAFAPQMQAA